MPRPRRNPDPIQLASATGFLRAQPVRAEPVRVQTAQIEPVGTAAATGNLSLFSQFYVPLPTAPQPQQTSRNTAGQATGKTSSSLFASTQRIFQRRVVPGQTGLTLKDYRAN